MELEYLLLMETYKPKVKLLGRNGNAFNILGICQRAANEAINRGRWKQARWDTCKEDMMSGDYNHLLATAMNYFDVT